MVPPQPPTSPPRRKHFLPRAPSKPIPHCNPPSSPPLQLAALPALTLPEDGLKGPGRPESGAQPFLHHREALWKRVLCAW